MCQRAAEKLYHPVRPEPAAAALMEQDIGTPLTVLAPHPLDPYRSQSLSGNSREMLRMKREACLPPAGYSQAAAKRAPFPIGFPAGKEAPSIFTACISDFREYPGIVIHN